MPDADADAKVTEGRWPVSRRPMQREEKEDESSCQEQFSNLLKLKVRTTRI